MSSAERYDTTQPLDTPAPQPRSPVRVRIEPIHGWASLRLGELWRYRELLLFLTWRDIKVRYKQTIFGASWAIIQPFFTMVVFSLFFGRLADIPSDGVPYPIFSYAALVPWTFFSNGLTNSAISMVNSARLITKVYFPRLIIPISTVMAGLVDFTLAFIVLIGMMLFYGINPLYASTPLNVPILHSDFTFGLLLYNPTANVIWLPFFLLLALVTSLGIGLWLAAMNVQFRDIRYVVPFLTQIWLFATPIAYPSSLLSEPWRTIYGLNPMAGVVEGFRWALLGTDNAPGPTILVSTVVAFALLISGMFYFQRMEKSFADVV
jgi:lipopolysaccharide transport system permease protein